MPEAPRIVAIVNLTEDSFSDGGRYIAPESAIRHAEALARSGADILELGPASSHPDAALVPAEVQIARLRAVFDARERLATPISVDATVPEVIRFALREGVSMVNDVRGFADASLYPELAEATASLVVVHSLLGLERATRDAATVAQVLESIPRFFDERLAELVRAGVQEERLLIDPGMGFFLGSDPRASIAVLRRLGDLRERYGRPVFVSVSRKSFLRRLTGRPVEAIGAATLAAELYAAAEGADFIRTHDAAALADGLVVRRALEEPD